MSFVPHQNRHELHGITVVVTTPARLFVGRLDTADACAVTLKDAGYHDDSDTRQEYLARTAKYGVKRLSAVIEIPTDSVQGIERLHQAQE